MDTVYGAYLLLTLCCTLYVTRQYIVWSQQCTTPRAKKVATILALVFVAFLWWFQEGYRHKYSAQAKTNAAIVRLLMDWKAGKKEKVIAFLDSYAGWGRDSSSGDPIEP